ncbi:MAG: methionine--tRNA ligase [Acholeplasmatales bacterium]|nr:methionine--tRNA ligase [Acholeplasmatales bacterium]
MAEKKTFYITTPIYYPSGKLTIGNAYTTIAADTMTRYKKSRGFDTFFLTGTDEHGLKIEQKAEAQGIKPQEFVDKMADSYKDLWKMLDVSYDRFIRTTDEDHVKAVQKIFERLLKQGDIYLGEYTGWYSVEDEEYFTESQLAEVYRDDDGNVIGGKAPSGHEVRLVKEPSYFFRMSKYADRLLQYYKDHPDFILPHSREKEMVNNFIKPGLEDLSVTRTTVDWGIPVPSDPKHVVYVWIDALSNYITALGYGSDNDALFKKYWPADVHLVGKEIVRFHTIYWPIMLMALDLPLPHQVFGHPWILTNHNKMSKSKNNVIYADDLTAIFGVDAVRYYVLHEIPFAQDGNITYELVCERSNSDLANTYGNLVSRTIAMVKKYFGDEKICKVTTTEFDKELIDSFDDSIKNYKKLMDEFKVGDALEEIMKSLRQSNKYIDETTPWALAKDESKKDVLKTVLYNLLESIRLGTILLEPAMPKTAAKVYKALNITDTEFNTLKFGNKESYDVNDCEILFKRLDVKEVMDQVLKNEEAKAKVVAPLVETEAKPEITIDDFDKLDLVVGQIKEASNHPKADKLLVFKVDIGTEVRQIVSGIAKFYKPEELVGKKVIVVKNLKPIKLRGIDSCGMLLCASDEKDTYLELVNINDCKPGDKVC